MELKIGSKGKSGSPGKYICVTSRVKNDGPNKEKWMWAGSEGQGAAQFSASGAFTDNLAQADPEKQKGFIESIASGNLHNQAAQGVESALTAMLGRKAGYLGREVTWDELVKSSEHWDAKIDVGKLG